MTLSPIEVDWPAPPNVRALCSTREGGASGGPYASLNLGLHVGDDAEAVGHNRARWQSMLEGAQPVYLAQVHGTRTVRVDRSSPVGIEADAAWTDEPGVACTIMVADCLPVLLATLSGSRVAAAHAGWRGLAGGVIESCMASMGAGLGERPASSASPASSTAPLPEPVIAWLGPCIGPRSFEVGGEVKAAFEAQDPGSAAHFERAAAAGKWWADLPGLARRRLLAAGAASVHGNDGSDRWCTVVQASRFFSHRRDRVSGRFAASIWRG